MELVFNEISFLPFANNEVVLKDQFISMLKLYEKTKTDFGYRHLIFPSNISETKVTADKTFVQWAYSITHQGDKNKILSVPFIRPFANDVLEEKIKELHKYYYENEEAGIEEEYCIGLATAYLKDKVAISIHSAECWNKANIIFKEIINEELETVDVNAINVTTDNHLTDATVKNKLMYAGALQLDESPINPDDKELTLSGDHHGNDKLKAFAKRLFKSKYVVSVINNIDFSPKAINLIKNVYPDGKIELVLHWESAGYGMVIQTTGKNMRETQEIAKLLKKEFDK